jgi:hypothetical protein
MRHSMRLSCSSYVLDDPQSVAHVPVPLRPFVYMRFHIQMLLLLCSYCSVVGSSALPGGREPRHHGDHIAPFLSDRIDHFREVGHARLKLDLLALFDCPVDANHGSRVSRGVAIGGPGKSNSSSDFLTDLLRTSPIRAVRGHERLIR